jgi:HSP20 family protein
MVYMNFEQLPEQGGIAAASSARMPRPLPMEMVRRGDQLVVAIDLPGVDPDEVEVTVERNVVEIGFRRQALHRAGDEVIVDERPHGGFRRQLFLGADLDPGDMTAACERGVLVLTIPASRASTPRKVEIDCADERRQALHTGSSQPRAVTA